MTREIPLTRGYVALVDDEDFGVLSAFNWCAQKAACKTELFYARRTLRVDEDFPWTNARWIGMHRQILCVPDGSIVDHINGNGLDNRRDNLRIASHSQNCINREYKNKSGFRGVYRTKSASRPYAASLRHEGEYIYLGTFVTDQDAARAYDKAALERFGNFARLNFKGPINDAA